LKWEVMGGSFRWGGKFGFVGLFDGKDRAIFSLALSPASRELSQRESL